MSLPLEVSLPVELERMVVAAALESGDLRGATLRSLRLVCHNWNIFSSAFIYSLTIRPSSPNHKAPMMFSYRACSKIAFSAGAQPHCWLLSRFPNVKELDLSKCRIGEAGIMAIAEAAPSVTILRLNAMGVSTSVLNNSIKQLQSLAELDVSLEGLNLTSGTLFTHPCLQSLKIRSFTAQSDFCLDVSPSVFASMQSLCAAHYVAIAVEFGSQACMRLTAAVDAPLLPGACRFVVAVDSNRGEPTALLWAGDGADQFCKLTYQSAKPLICRLLPAVHIERGEFASLSQMANYLPQSVAAGEA